MAYTLEQLTRAYTAVHDGIAPSAATVANFRIVAVLSAQGQMSDAQILGNIINSADGTTALAVLSYQFFTGKSPSKAGLDYLVNSPVNTSDLNDPYYARFGLENRYINFAANLGVRGEGAANFAARYGAMSFGEFVAAIYQTIIGASYATAAGVDAAMAIADITSRKDAILATAQGAGMITPDMTAAQVDLAVKAATAGYLLGEAIKADVGLYAAAASNFMAALATGTAVYNTDITLTYRPTVDSIAHGTGKAADRGAVLPTPEAPGPTGPVAMALTLVAGVNTVTGGDGDDTFTGTNVTFSAANVLNGGAGNDTLTLTGSGGGFTVPNASVSGIETVNVNNTDIVSIDTLGWSGVTRLNVTAQGSGTFVRAASSTNITVNNSSVGGGILTVDGGRDVTINATLGNGWLAVGNGLYVTGALTVNVAGSTGGVVSLYGGTTIDITQEGGVLQIQGGAMTKSVKVKASAPLAFITLTDTHVGGPTVGTIETLDVEGATGNSTIQASGLTTLKLTNSSGNFDIDRFGATSPPTTLALTMSNTTIGSLTDSANAYATINITTGALAAALGNINNAGLTTLNIAGASKLTLGTATASNLTTLDASGITAGGFEWTSGALNGAATIKGAATSANVINASAALSTIAYTGGTAADTVTVNALANTVDVGTDSAVDTVKIGAPGATGAVFTEIKHMAPGDKLDFTAVTSGMTSLVAPTVLGAQPSLAAALNIAAAGDGSGTPILTWFTWNGDTYVVADRSAGGFVDGTDYVVKLAGTSLTSASIAGTVLTFA